MFCTKCGSQLAPDGSCPRCAQAAQQAQPQPQFQQYQNPAPGYTPAPTPKPAANFDFQALMQDKLKVMMILAGVAAVLLLFLPVISVAAMGVSQGLSVFQCFEGGDSPTLTGLFTLVSIAGAGLTIYGCYKKDKKLYFYGALGAAGALLISAVTTLLYANEVKNALNEMSGGFSIGGAINVSPGLGFWIGIILLGINAYIAYTESKK